MNNRKLQYAKLFKITSKKMEYYSLKGLYIQAEICDDIKWKPYKKYISQVTYC